MTRRAALLAALLLLLPQGARAQAPPPVAETVAIPLTEKRRLGAPRELHLEAFLYRPALTGSLPVLVLERYDCERAVLAAGVERAVEDLDAALAFVAARPWADPTRLLLGGMSRGGLLAVLYPSRRAVAARGVVNFAGGWTVERCDGRTRFNEDTFAEAGRTARLPMLWLYSENARNYGPAAVRGYHQGFVRAGGAATLEMFPPIGHDGHILPPGEVRAWRTAVSDFLMRLDLGEPRVTQ